MILHRNMNLYKQRHSPIIEASTFTHVTTYKHQCIYMQMLIITYDTRVHKNIENLYKHQHKSRE